MNDNGLRSSTRRAPEALIGSLISTPKKGVSTNKKNDEEGTKGMFQKGDIEGELKEQWGDDHMQVTDQDTQWCLRKNFNVEGLLVFRWMM